MFNLKKMWYKIEVLLTKNILKNLIGILSGKQIYEKKKLVISMDKLVRLFMIWTGYVWEKEN